MKSSSAIGQFKRSSADWFVVFCFLILLAPAQALGSETSTKPAERADRQTLITAWREANSILRESLIRELQNGSTYILYETQEHTANLLRWAAENNEKQVLQGLEELYAMAFPFARQRGSLVLPYAGPVDVSGGQAREWIVTVPTPVYAWLPENHGDPFESELTSAQFLYAVARLSRALVAAQVPREAFLSQARTLLLDHLNRWVFGIPGVPGTFQTTGWGCSVGTFDHWQHIENLRQRSYGTAKYPRRWSSPPPKYCNAVTDTDIFIVSIAGEILALNELSPTEFELDPSLRERFKEYLSDGLQVLHERFHKASVKNPLGGTLDAILFDIGMWDDHPDQRYSGYTGDQFPGWKSPEDKRSAIEPKPARGVGWDISHARRFVYFLDTLEALESAGIQTGFSREDRIAIARGLVLGPWNANKEQPRFANFVDGTNGWYRVNYSDRPGFGYPPFGMEPEMVRAGYGFLHRLEPATATLLLARWKLDREATPLKRNGPLELVEYIPVLLTMKAGTRDQGK